MIFIPYTSTVYSRQKTATADTPFQVEPSGSPEGETLLSSVNIHCTTNSAYYGNMANQSAPILTNAVVWFDGLVKVSDLWFKNYTAGSNCVITVVGLVVKAK